MMPPRLIAVVTLLGDAAVKTRCFERPRYVGDPINTISLLSAFEVEELVLLDISESHQVAKTKPIVLERILENAFMPISYGGGIRSAKDAKFYFDLGFDKVILRSALFDTDVVQEISHDYGTQAVSGCLDVIYDESTTSTMTVNGREIEVTDYDEIIEHISQLTIGELMVQDVARDGTREGMRMHPLLEKSIENLQIPVVAVGGAASVENAASFVKISRCHSVAASTMFLFHPSRNSVLVAYPSVDKWQQLVEESTKS